MPKPVGACALTPCEHIVSGLTNGAAYYVRVFAYNSYGFSIDGAITTPPAETPCTQAMPPAVVNVRPSDNATSLAVSFAPSAQDGGCPITLYKLEWDAAGGLGFREGASRSASLLYSEHEVQVVTVVSTANDLGGTYRLALAGHATGPIAATASASAVQAALEEVPSVGGVVVTREQAVGTSSNLLYGFDYAITFTGQAGSPAADQWVGDVPALTVSTDDRQYPAQFGALASAGNMLTGTSPTVAVATAVDGYRGFEQQLVEVGVATGKLRGTFRLTYGSESTVPLPWNASSLAVEAALLALDLEGTASLRVARKIHNGNGGASPESGMQWRLVFRSAAGNVPLVGVDAKGLRSTVLSGSVTSSATVLQTGYQPSMDSSLRRELVLSGDALAAAASDPEGLIRATIAPLESGEAYHVRVSAFNGIGNSYGNARHGTRGSEASPPPPEPEPYPNPTPTPTPTLTLTQTRSAPCHGLWTH